jgi:hypothetical protein
LDIWIWGADNALRGILRWPEANSIRGWLAERGYVLNGNQKPARPKDALDELMVRLDQPWSSVLYERITGKISLAQCVDPAFKRLRSTLQSWFPP